MSALLLAIYGDIAMGAPPVATTNGGLLAAAPVLPMLASDEVDTLRARATVSRPALAFFLYS